MIGKNQPERLSFPVRFLFFLTSVALRTVSAGTGFPLFFIPDDIPDGKQQGKGNKNNQDNIYEIHKITLLPDCRQHKLKLPISMQ